MAEGIKVDHQVLRCPGVLAYPQVGSTVVYRVLEYATKLNKQSVK